MALTYLEMELMSRGAAASPEFHNELVWMHLEAVRGVKSYMGDAKSSFGCISRRCVGSRATWVTLRARVDASRGGAWGQELHG
jgi:hypothetical protein